MVTVKMTEQAAVQFAQLPKTIRERIRKLIGRLEKWPDVSGVKGLSGNLAGWHRMRTSDYRLRFQVQEDALVVDLIGHRSEFYEG